MFWPIVSITDYVKGISLMLQNLVFLNCYIPFAVVPHKTLIYMQLLNLFVHTSSQDKKETILRSVSKTGRLNSRNSPNLIAILASELYSVNKYRTN